MEIMLAHPSVLEIVDAAAIGAVIGRESLAKGQVLPAHISKVPLADHVPLLVSRPREQLRQRLLAGYPGETRHLEIHVLDIPDDYGYMDGELVEELKARVRPVLGRHRFED